MGPEVSVQALPHGETCREHCVMLVLPVDGGGEPKALVRSSLSLFDALQLEPAIHICPCGASLQEGRDGRYCTRKCGMLARTEKIRAFNIPCCAACMLEGHRASE